MTLLRVKALADRVGVTAETVRHYQRIGLLRAHRDPHNGYKLFDEEQEQRLRCIVQMRQLGFSLREIAEVLEDVDQGRSACPRLTRLLQRHIEEERRRQAELERRLARMEALQARWSQLQDAPAGLAGLRPLMDVAEMEEKLEETAC